jgi:hypothetical protein
MTGVMTTGGVGGTTTGATTTGTMAVVIDRSGTIDTATGEYFWQ